MQNFYTSKDNFTDKTVRLSGEEHHHATRSCRVKIGEIIGVTDGCGKRVYARIGVIDSQSLTAVIERDVSDVGEPDSEITVAISVIKPARFEIAVEKCTELGVRHFVPLLTERCEQDISNRLKIERLSRIALEAAKQSGRSWVPEIVPPINLVDFLKKSKGSVLAASQKADKSLEMVYSFIKDNNKLTLVIGPEGDFADGEYNAMIEHGVLLFSMGELTLRTETAGIAATTLVVNILREHSRST